MLLNKELLIIASLRRNSRQSLTNMSKAIRIPISTIFDKLKVQEKNIIRKHTSIIDFSKLGFNTRANIIIKVDKEHKESLKDYLNKDFNVNSVYKINNGFDFLIECIFKNVKDVEDFMEKLEDKFKVTEKHIYYIIEDIKREEFMSDPHTLNLVYA